jgi:hypothetical protein
MNHQLTKWNQMNTTPSNYLEREHHLIDPSTADDGFGNHVLTDLKMFWHNVDAFEADRRSPT